MGEMVEALDLQEADRTSMAVPFDERIRMMVDYAWEAKRASSVRRLVQRARLRFPDAEMGEMIYDGRGIDGVLIREAGTCQFMEPDERIEKSLGHMSPNNTVGAYAQRFRRVRGNRPRPPGVWMNLEINWPRRCRILCVETRVSAPLGVSFALGCDSTEGLLCYESR